MKHLSKKIALILAFCFGTVIFAGAAFADSAIKNGYEQLKDSAKTMVIKMADVKNYTTITSTKINSGSNLISQVKTINKLADYTNELTSITTDKNGNETKNYFYNSSEMLINYSSSDDTYYVTELENFYSDKFQPTGQSMIDEFSRSYEKLLDSFINTLNLQNCVIPTKNDDGSYTFISSLNESQMPPLLNAVISFYMKNAMLPIMRPIAIDANYIDKNISVPYQPYQGISLTSKDDVYIKGFDAKLETYPNGLLKAFNIKAVISGLTVEGNNEDVTFEYKTEIKDPNKTIITPPDLTGKNVVDKNKIVATVKTLPEFFVGSYSSNIFENIDGSLKNVGSYKLEIKSIKDNLITGTFTETRNDLVTSTDFESKTSDGTSAEIKLGTMSGYLFFNENDFSINIDLKTTDINNPLIQTRFTRDIEK